MSRIVRCEHGCGELRLPNDCALSDHLRQVHGLDVPDERAPLLDLATYRAIREADDERAEADANLPHNLEQARRLRARYAGISNDGATGPGRCADCGVDSIARWVVGAVGACCYRCTAARRKAARLATASAQPPHQTERSA